MPRVPELLPMTERFNLSVDKTDTCWNFNKKLTTDGYGRIRVRIDSKAKSIRIHRLAWELYNGPIPQGLDVLHRCDNRKCARPDHLFLGTDIDNMRDMAVKGRAGMAKLSKEQVLNIRAEYEANPRRGTIAQLAQEHGVCIQTICNVVHRRNYRYIKSVTSSTLRST